MPYYDGGLGSGSGDMQNYNNNRYVTYNNRGPVWRGREAHAAWAKNNYIDERGQLQGDFQYVPHSLAQTYQGIHDVRTYNYRDQVMRDSVAMSKGAANLMSSYRQGGSAAIESGIMQQTAGLNMQRASMIQPMDLMQDYRRYVNERERRAREISFDQNLYAGIAAGIGASFNPVYADAAQGHFEQASADYTASQMGGTGYSGNVAGGQAQGGGGGGQQARPAVSGGVGSSGGSSLMGSAMAQDGQGQGVAGVGAMVGAQGGTAAASTLQGGGGAGPQGGTRGASLTGSGPQSGGGSGGGSGSGGGGGGTGAGSGGGGKMVQWGGGFGNPTGADGDFSSNAYARNGAAQSPYVSTAMGQAVADRYEDDEFYDWYNAEIENEMLKRRSN